MTTDIIRVSIFGNLPGGERWSINPCYRLDGSSAFNYATALAAVTAVNAVAVPTNLLSVMSSSTSVTGCRVEGYSYAGELQAKAEGLRGSGGGGTGPEALPFQTSLVISLRSVATGPSGRGRLYWPATGMVLTASTLRPTSGAIGFFLNDAKTYLTNIGTALDGVAGIDSTLLAVWSRKNANSSGVLRIMAGDVLDTQRRRRDSIPETYQELTYFTGALSQLE